MVKYLRVVIKNLEPLRIADGDTSQSGQTSAVRYIPGSTLRGFLFNSFADNNELDAYIKILCSDKIRFCNGYLTTKSHTLIPSPKGLYEYKNDEEKKVVNAFSTPDLDGRKRAAVGRFCYLEDGCICYYSVDAGSDLKLMINDRGSVRRDPESDGEAKSTTVFREEYITEGQYFESFICMEDIAEELEQKICEKLGADQIIYLGNSRSSGHGRCQIVISEMTDALPYGVECYDVKNRCYMMLLSKTVMLDQNGQYTGLDTETLGALLGVEKLSIKAASTSIKHVRGYNRTWKSALPSVPMYEEGSIFLLEFNGTITCDRMEAVCHAGIGIRRNEGFGRVLFVRDYDGINRKQHCDYVYDREDVPKEVDIDALKRNPDEWDTLCSAANGYYRRQLSLASERYVIDTPLRAGGISNSQLGIVESIVTKNRYNAAEAKKILNEYFAHADEKEGKQNIHKTRASLKTFEKSVREILGMEAAKSRKNKSEKVENYRIKDLGEILFGETHRFAVEKKVMGVDIQEFFRPEDEWVYRQKLLIDLIRFARKEN